MKIIFMGTPAFAIPALKALLGSAHEVIAVYTQPPRPAGRGQKLQASPVQQLAEERGIPVFHPVSLKSADEQQKFAALGAEMAVVAAYGLLLPEAILNAPARGCINIHPSLLPRWRGAAPIQRPIIAGDTETGICIMQMDKGLDTGDVWLRETMPLPANATAGAMHDLLAERSAELLLQAIEGIEKNMLTRTPQSDEGVTYANKITKEEAQIDWTLSARTLHNHIRGLSAYTLLNGEIFKILQAEIVVDSGTHGAAGTVISDDFIIACGEGSLRVLRVQKAGKQAMSAEDFLRGTKEVTGYRF